MTVKAAAKFLNVSANTIYGLCAAKRIRHVRVGVGRGRLLIPEAAIEEYLKGRTVEVADPSRRPPQPSTSSGPFTMLDGERLAEAWQATR